MTKRSGSDWWQLDHDDYWTSDLVLEMSDGAKAVYLFFLGLQAKNGSLPRDPRLVRASLSACSERSWRDFASFLDRAFPVDASDGRRRNLKQAQRLAKIDADRERDRVRKSDSRAAGTAPDVQRTSGGRHEKVRQERREREEEKEPLTVRGLADPPRADGSSPPRVDEIPISGRIAVHVAADSSLGQFALHWLAEWGRTRAGAVYTLVETDVGALARALRLANGDLDEVKRRATALLESKDPFEAKKASPEWLARSDVWSRLGAEVARTTAKRSTDPPGDASRVSDWWHHTHRVVSTIEVGGREYQVAGPDVPYPGYDEAKREMLAARAALNSNAATPASATG